jgi:Asp-tRNA(Asn)/Glu-tRNA(Gln) amidotransferase A subunit family amidase
LPMGMQITAPPAGESLLLKTAHFLDHHRQEMPLRPQIDYSEGSRS